MIRCLCCVFVVLLHFSHVFAAEVWPVSELCAGAQVNNIPSCLCSTGLEVPSRLGGAFSVDRRTYVDNATWQSSVPYKHVLRMGGYIGAKQKWKTYCTANMVRGKIVTAKHCLDDNSACNNPSKRFLFRDVDGRDLTAHVVACGNWQSGTAGLAGDWAVLVPDNAETQSIVDANDTYGVTVWQSGMSYPINSAGFGSLAIMSDDEIKMFQQVYLAYLDYKGKARRPLVRGVAVGDSEEEPLGQRFTDDLYWNSTCHYWLRNFDNAKNRDYYETECLDGNGKYKYSGLNYVACGMEFRNFFYDTEQLKNSACSVGFGGLQSVDCQGWSGNSGAGIYMATDDSLIGLLSQGAAAIGSEFHAGSIKITSAGGFVDKLSADGANNRSVDVTNDGDNDGRVTDGPDLNNDDSNDDRGSVDVGGREIAAVCAVSDLPEYAKSGQYRASIKGKLVCNGGQKCYCHATKCVDGSMLINGVCKPPSGAGSVDSERRIMLF